MFIEKEGCIEYKSKGTGIIYSLLEGYDSNGKSSDIVFIFREPTAYEIEQKGYTGEVIGNIYGGFDILNRKAIENEILDYEKKL